MKKRVFLIMALAWATCIPAQETGSEARSFFDRGLDAIGRATTRRELKVAVATLAYARDAAPKWAEVHYALGRVLQFLDIYDRAVVAFEKYLELATEPADREQVMDFIRTCRQRQEWLEHDQRLMAFGAWRKLQHLPPVRFSLPMVSTRFRIDGEGRMSAQHPYLETFDKSRQGSVRNEWSPVTFDGKYFEYAYRVYFEAQNPPRTEYTIETVRGEVIQGVPTQVRQAVYHMSSSTFNPEAANKETLIGEVLHELR